MKNVILVSMFALLVAGCSGGGDGGMLPNPDGAASALERESLARTKPAFIIMSSLKEPPPPALDGGDPIIAKDNKLTIGNFRILVEGAEFNIKSGPGSFATYLGGVGHNILGGLYPDWYGHNTGDTIDVDSAANTITFARGTGRETVVQVDGVLILGGYAGAAGPATLTTTYDKTEIYRILQSCLPVTPYYTLEQQRLCRTGRMNVLYFGGSLDAPLIFDGATAPFTGQMPQPGVLTGSSMVSFWEK